MTTKPKRNKVPTLTKIVYARIPAEWEERLLKEAYEKHLSISELIRELIKPEGL